MHVGGRRERKTADGKGMFNQVSEGFNMADRMVRRTCLGWDDLCGLWQGERADDSRIGTRG